MLEVIADVGAVLTGLGAGWIVWLGHQLARRQRTDAWLQNLNQLHGEFWDDPDLAEVREWLASGPAYEALRQSIEVRFLRPEEMSPADYHRIELLDKFFNFLIRVRLVDSELGAELDLWSELSFSFWLKAITDRSRWHLLVYFEHTFANTRLGPLLTAPDEGPDAEAVRDTRRQLLASAASLNSAAHLPRP
jgi:hypothetical protein